MKRPPIRYALSLTLAFFLAGCSGEPPIRQGRPASPPVEVGNGIGGKADGFDWGSPCRAGTGTFTQPIAKDAVVLVGEIPAGRVGVEIKLTSPEDVDIQLYDKEGNKAIVQWPDGLMSGDDTQSITYKGIKITWSGYNGDGTNLGHEYIKLEGETSTTFVMKAYGYAAGAAQVDYKWAAKPNCKDQGKGSFEQPITKDAVVEVGPIPKGLSNVEIELTSPVDIDVQLYDKKDGKAIVKWPGGMLKGADEQSIQYAGVKVIWSGYNGDGSGKGNEFIRLVGTTDRDLVMKVFGYEAGAARVDYSWGADDPNAKKFEADVIFAPAKRHEDKVLERIQKAEHSIDIAMYNMKHTGIFNALSDAVKNRNIKVRLIYHGAQADRKSPAGTRSAQLEDLGIDVRYASKSKTMHHKYMIVDGPRGENGKPQLTRANKAWLVTGSGNWAQGNHNENTLFLRGVPELVLHFQNEFNRLWTYSWDFFYKEAFSYQEALTLDTNKFIDEPNQAAFFTSANMRSNQSFTLISGSEVVGESIVDELNKATKSIEIASGHMRSKLVYDALVGIHKNKPGVKIRVYLDGQEYTKDAYGDYYGYLLHKAGIDVRFKYYAYRWDYHYAPQMHNKYFIIDDKTLLSGSYNLSDNSEFKSLENIIFVGGDKFLPVIKKYEADFDRLWTTEIDGKKLSSLKQKIGSASSIPLVFTPMALTHPQIKSLKELIETNCPAAWRNDKNPLYEPDYGKNPKNHKTCPRK